MFNLVHDTMKSTDVSYYKEKLDFLLREFLDLKYVIDPSHEKDVLAKLLYNLAASAICRQGIHAASKWAQSHRKNPFEIAVQAEHTYIDYAAEMGMMISMFDNKSTSEFEMIRIVICFTKAKGYDPRNIFTNLIKNIDELV